MWRVVKIVSLFLAPVVFGNISRGIQSLELEPTLLISPWTTPNYLRSLDYNSYSKFASLLALTLGSMGCIGVQCAKSIGVLLRSMAAWQANVYRLLYIQLGGPGDPFQNIKHKWNPYCQDTCMRCSCRSPTTQPTTFLSAVSYPWSNLPVALSMSILATKSNNSWLPFEPPLGL